MNYYVIYTTVLTNRLCVSGPFANVVECNKFIMNLSHVDGEFNAFHIVRNVVPLDLEILTNRSDDNQTEFT